MFWKKAKKETVCYFPANNGILEMNQATYDYIRKLHSEIDELKSELSAIKPILDDPDLRPALSVHCDKCKYVVYSPRATNFDMFGNYIHKTILGCRRNALCSYYMPHDEQEDDGE